MWCSNCHRRHCFPPAIDVGTSKYIFPLLITFLSFWLSWCTILNVLQWRVVYLRLMTSFNDSQAVLVALWRKKRAHLQHATLLFPSFLKPALLQVSARCLPLCWQVKHGDESLRYLSKHHESHCCCLHSLFLLAVLTVLTVCCKKV